MLFLCIVGRRRTELCHFSDIGIDVHRNANGAGLARFCAYWERRKHTPNTPCNRQSACWCCTNRRGLLAILHAAAAHCGQALKITTDEVTLGCAGLPRHPQPHTTDPLPMVLPRFQSVCLDLPNWGRGGGDKRVGRETRTPPAPENTDVKEKAACCSCPYNTSIVIIRGHVFMTRRRRRCTCARESTRPSACEAATCVHLLCEGGKIGGDE